MIIMIHYDQKMQLATMSWNIPIDSIQSWKQQQQQQRKQKAYLLF
jgi:hypothetical protein